MKTQDAVITAANLRVLILLTWYSPHLSGLTVAVRRLAEGLQARGLSVTVLAARHAEDLASTEFVGGVRVVRVDVAARLSKGFLMPGYFAAARELCEDHDLVVGVLPAGPFECLGMWLTAARRPLAIEYVCDIRLPGGWFDKLVERSCAAIFRWVAHAASAVVFTSKDYALTSPFREACEGKIYIAPLPIAIPQPDPQETARLRALASTQGPVVGMAGRFAHEKGFELLLEALPAIRERFPDVTVLCAGEYKNVVGEDQYRRRMMPRIEALGRSWQMLGVVQPDLASFFAACDVLAFPSTNRTESFGMVQAEAMLCGVPVVASDLPGIRVAVQTTGMGKLFAAGDVDALSASIVEVLERREAFLKPRSEVQAAFSDRDAVSKRLEVYTSLTRNTPAMQTAS